MPLSKEERDRLCCETLNTFLFDRVWNEPYSEYRVNIKPVLLKDQSVIGSFSLFDGNLKLPTNSDAYFLWAMSTSDFTLGLRLNTNQWYSTAEICNDWNTRIDMYGMNGKLFAKGQVHVYYNSTRSTLFIAAKKHVVARCVPVSKYQTLIDALRDVHLTIYYDSDRVRPMRIHSLYMDSLLKKRDYQLAINRFLTGLKEEHHLQIFADGVEVTSGTKVPSLELGSYYDFLIDENIAFTFDVDLVSDTSVAGNQNPVFLSDKHSTWKQLIHIPKDKNPDNKVITHNTCDFFVRRKYPRVHSTEGYLLHRLAGERGVQQVTHQDYGVAMFVIDAYRDYLGTNEVTLHGVVRIHDKNNTLLQDASYIDLLYSDVHDDKDIVDILVGKGPENIPWWKASQLEKSKYIEMLFDTPNLATTDHMKEYVDALGFYQVVNLLCRRVVDSVITDAFKGSLTFSLPILYAGMEVTPVVYLNGRVVDKDKITYSRHDNNTLTIHFHPDLYTKTGDQLNVVFFVDGDNTVFEFTPTMTNLTIHVPYDDVAIYRKQEVPDAVKLQGIAQSSYTSYVEQTKSSAIYTATVNKNGGLDITFNYELAGETFIIESAYCSYYQTYDLAEYTTTGKTIAIPVEAPIFGTDRTCPIFNFKNVGVYLNGAYLVRDIDYFINTVKDSDGNISFSELVVQTMDHFNEGGSDILNILYNVAEIEDISHGFAVNDTLKDSSPVNLYFPNISTVHVGGKLERDVEYRGVYIQLEEDKHEQGAVFEIQTSVPKLVKNFIEEHISNTDIERVKILNEYFYQLIQEDLPYLILERKHRIYSTFMNNFIHDVMMNKIAVVDEPDLARMKEQIKPYLYLKDMDLCFNKLDQRFVDYYPQYVNYEIDPDVKRVLDRFIKEFMPSNIAPTVEVVYE